MVFGQKIKSMHKLSNSPVVSTSIVLNNEFLDFPDFQIIDFHHRARSWARSFSKYENQNENQKTLKTRPERPSFRNGLGTVPGVYEATTIAHRTPPALAVTMVGGTCGVFKTSFWPNITSAPPNLTHCMHGLKLQL